MDYKFLKSILDLVIMIKNREFTWISYKFVMMCEGYKIGLIEAVTVFQGREKSLNMLTNHGIISNDVKFNQSGKSATFKIENLQWRCQRRQIVKTGKKVIKKKCTFKQSVRTDTWLENAHLTPEKCCMFIALYLLLNPPHQEFLERELKIQRHTVVDWSSYVCEVLEDWCFNNSSQKLSGSEVIVEIDKAKFGKRKYNCGRIIDGMWLFGGFERGTRNIFIEAVPNRASTTLLKVIQRRILPGTTIILDCWRAYNCLQEKGFRHLTVNHSINFADPNTGAHTQHIKCTWRDARGAIPKFGRVDEHMNGYITEYLFRRHFPNHEDRLHHFWMAVKRFNSTDESSSTHDDTETSELE